MPEVEYDEPTLVRISVPLAAWIVDHNKASWLTGIGLIAMLPTVIWAPWWARLIFISGMALVIMGIELENLTHRIDGANTMMWLMKSTDNTRD